MGELILMIVVLMGLLFIYPKRIGDGSIDDILLQPDFVLSYDDRIEIIEGLKKEGKGNNHVYCSACSSAVEISFLRRAKGEHLKHAVCLPCFLNNHTDADQEDIDMIVKIARKKGWYMD